MSAKEAEENARVLADEMKELKEEFDKEATVITARWENAVKEIEDVAVKPKKTGIEIMSFFLVWVPSWQMVISDVAGNTRTEKINASR